MLLPMKKSHQFILAAALLLPIFLTYALRPVPIVTEDEALTIHGKVSELRERKF